MPVAVVLLILDSKVLERVNNILNDVSSYFKGIAEIVTAKNKLTKEDIKKLVECGVRKIVVLPIVENLRKHFEKTYIKKLKLADGRVKVVYAKPMLSSEITANNVILEIEKFLKP